MLQEKICYGCMQVRKLDDGSCPYCGFDLEKYMKDKNPEALNPGEILHERYLVGMVLGSGGFGISYVGFDQLLQIKVAIKEYFPSEYASRNTMMTSQYYNEVRFTRGKEIFEAGLERFLSEARTLAHFNKMSGIVSVTDFFHENGTGYMIMDYLPGLSLKQMVLSRDDMIGEQEILQMMRPVFDALHSIHQEKLIHRDISPDNLIMDSNGQLTLIDFGAARDVTEMGKSLTVVLKHGYAPLEQYTTTGEQGPWTDIYALCATMYFMMTRAVPPASIDRVLEDKELSLADLGMPVSKAFSDAIQKGLEVQARDRFHSIEELKAALYEHKSIASMPESDQVTVPFHSEPTIPDYPSAQPDNYYQSVQPDNHYQSVQPNRGYNAMPPGGYQSAQPNQQSGTYPTGNNQQSGNMGKYMIALISGVCIMFFAVAVFFGLKNLMGSPDSKAKIEAVNDESATEPEMEEITGTYASYKGININYIPIYKNLGDTEKSGKIAEGRCVQVLGRTLWNNTYWFKVNYCGKEGWAEESYFRYVSDGDDYFHISNDTAKNTIFVNENLIKLHAEPKTKSAYVGPEIPYGTEFKALELKNGWALIEYNGTQCWIDMYVCNYYATDYWQVEICNGGGSKGINLRKKPSGTSKSYGKIPPGTVLKITERKNGWGKVTYGGNTGWVMLHYMTSCPPEGLAFSEDTQ